MLSFFSIHPNHTLLSKFPSLGAVFSCLQSCTPSLLSFKSKTTVTMQFTISAVLALAATVAALPPVGPSSAGGEGNANGVANKGNTNVRFPVPDDMTVKQAQAKCGDQAQLSCCNKATYAGDLSSYLQFPTIKPSTGNFYCVQTLISLPNPQNQNGNAIHITLNQ